MARRFAKVSEEEIEEAFFYPFDLVNTKTTIPFRVGEERWIYTSTLRVSVYIHHYSPPLRGIVVYYQYDRFTIPSYKPGKLKRARLTTNFKNLNHLILWRYPVEKTKRVSNR